MRLFLDECLSPRIALELAEEYNYLIVHPRNNGGLGAPDYQIVIRCLEEDLVIVTEDSKDFIALLNSEEIHPDLIILPNIPILTSKALIKLAIEYLWRLELGNPMDLMVNNLLIVSNEGVPSLNQFPYQWLFEN
ncbi:MAG: DUF5615 family PIN-like protein [Paracoccaceae bacterium]|nr:DUF5615 family PIN-like protein [Paracoccaceae bacterium]MDE2675114.1 DUF5615 family PIN-like protein [Paracoccaceae bacterium]